MKIIGFIALIIVVPLLIDLFIFGNAFPSNIDNQAWAGFLGSYLGGIATLVAVFITISDNNKKIEEQKLYEQERIAEEKKAAVKPYLDTRYIFFNEDAEFGLNDRVFDIKDGIVDKVRYGLTSMDEKYIKMRQTVPSFVYLKYIIRNIGAGSAVNMQVNVNGFSEKITIAKDETVNLYMLISLGNEKSVPFNVLLDYWDVEKRAHYNQSEEFEIIIDGTHQKFKIKSVSHKLKLKILSSRNFRFTTNFTTNRQYQLAQSCSDLPQSVIPEHNKNPRNSSQNRAFRGKTRRTKTMIKILFICHGNILTLIKNT